MSRTPTFLDMPESASNPDTPSEMPGTPTSTTTSLSALSTTAIKDGHRGAPLPGHHGHQLSTTTNLEAERADRISRLAGLERVSTARPTSQTGSGNLQPAPNQIPGYFDAAGNPVYTTKMSTVGSASATGSVGGRTTTWASGSTRGAEDEDQMSTDANFREDDRDRYSTMAQSEDGDGMSDEGNASLVGFGEAAGSTVSGPTYGGGRLRPAAGQAGAGTDTAERIVRDRLDDGDDPKPAMGTPEGSGLGKFYFEDKK